MDPKNVWTLLKLSLIPIGFIFIIFFLIISLGNTEESTPVNDEIVSTSTRSTNNLNSDTESESVTTQTTNQGAKEYYPVLKVVDGDTLSVSIDGHSTTLRLIGINTPETVDPRKPVECFGKEASNRAKALLSGKKVSIELDPSQGNRDKYDRILAYVFLEDGTNFNKLMIQEGYAYEYTYDKPYKYQQEFKLAQANAKNAGVGLWATDACSTKAETTTPVVVPVTSKTPTQTPPSSNSSSYNCSTNTYNCTNFSSQEEAQTVFEMCGGTANDVHELDRDQDGSVCESL